MIFCPGKPHGVLGLLLRSSGVGSCTCPASLHHQIRLGCSSLELPASMLLMYLRGKQTAASGGCGVMAMVREAQWTWKSGIPIPHSAVCLLCQRPGSGLLFFSEPLQPLHRRCLQSAAVAVPGRSGIDGCCLVLIRMLASMRLT